MFVYVIVNSETQKIYVGQHKGDNLQKYLQTKQSNARRNSGTRSHLFAAMRKHPEGWSIHPLVSNIGDKRELDETEQLLIYALKAQHPDVGYNICDGGEGFTGPHTEEWKRNCSIKSKAWHASLSEEDRQEQNRKISEATMGIPRPHSSEAEVKRVAAFQVAVAEGKTKSYGMRGKKHSEETRNKMRDSAKARGVSPETIQKLIRARRDSCTLLQTIAWG